MTKLCVPLLLIFHNCEALFLAVKGKFLAPLGFVDGKALKFSLLKRDGFQIVAGDFGTCIFWILLLYKSVGLENYARYPSHFPRLRSLFFEEKEFKIVVSSRIYKSETLRKREVT